MDGGGEREREDTCNKADSESCTDTSHYLDDEAGHLVAVKLIWVLTVYINHGHVSLSLLVFSIGEKKNDKYSRDFFYQNSSVFKASKVEPGTCVL